MATPLNVIIDDLVAMNEYLFDVAMGDGLAFVLVAVGSLLIAASVAVLGGLTLGAAVDLVTGD